MERENPQPRTLHEPRTSNREPTQVFGFRHRNTLTVADKAAATLLHVTPPAGLTAVCLELDGFVLELLHFGREGNGAAGRRSLTEPGLTRLSFGVPDMAAACELVTACGGQVIEGTTLDGLAVLVRDPGGQLLELPPRR
jgi:hypothetical protein